VLTNPNVLQSA